MNSWRDNIHAEFIPNINKLIFVADPDFLFTEEKLTIELKNKGFNIIEFNDAIEFRYFYESNYTNDKDKGDLIVILRRRNASLEKLPYDLHKTGTALSFDLGQMFPNMSYPVIKHLDKNLLDDLFSAQKKIKPDSMGDNATKDFILCHVYKIAAELITGKTDLLQMLLRLHYSNQVLPEMLSQRLVETIQAQGEFHDWPLEEIIKDALAFFAFLQERWPVFLDSLKAPTRQVDEDLSRYGLKFQGPALLPFDHHNVLVYIDNLFVERKLRPIPDNSKKLDLSSWIRSGISLHEQDDKMVQINRFYELLEKQHLSENSSYKEWVSFAFNKAELEALICMKTNVPQYNQFIKLKHRLNQTFTRWLETHFSSLVNLPPIQPVMLHHLPRQAARSIKSSKNHRIAIIVVDGLSLDQWITVREVLKEQCNDLNFRESAVFAWIPTITSVSRQALFSGKVPLFFPKSIHTTNNEQRLWQQFWEDSGLLHSEIGYKRGLGSGDAVETMDSLFNPEQIKAVALVIDTVDKIMHGMQLGTAGMHSQVKQWCKKGFLSSLIDYLLKHKFQVWMTSDHGNIECKGIGRSSEGVIAQTRGERARIYLTPELRDKAAQKFSGTLPWQPIGLPSKYYPLIANGTDAFVNKNKTIVTHGGISIEEVIVPLIKFEKRGFK